MSNTTETKTLPAYRIYSVSKNGERKPVWQEIGAAWKHKDGKGLSLQFTARPLEARRSSFANRKLRKSSRTLLGKCLALMQS